MQLHCKNWTWKVTLLFVKFTYIFDEGVNVK